MEKSNQCECGEVFGERCARELGNDAVAVEWMPEHLRASHAAAGNAGSFPLNGASRLRCAPACASMIADQDPEWSRTL